MRFEALNEELANTASDNDEMSLPRKRKVLRRRSKLSECQVTQMWKSSISSSYDHRRCTRQALLLMMDVMWRDECQLGLPNALITWTRCAFAWKYLFFNNCRIALLKCQPILLHIFEREGAKLCARKSQRNTTGHIDVRMMKVLIVWGIAILARYFSEYIW